KLLVNHTNLLLVNLGNDRHNVTPLVVRMRKAKDLDALNFVVQEALSSVSASGSQDTGNSLVRTMVFVDSLCAHLRSLLPAHLHEQVDFFHSLRTSRVKGKVMRRFRDGRIKILCTTEAAAMGMDVGDIVRIVQYKVPRSLCIWFQRYGRAGR
ncbi:P-loop containing nucleoside triphosphate hydrolase protein, partial [Panus rudis PR-1116 ss-1]